MSRTCALSGHQVNHVLEARRLPGLGTRQGRHVQRERVRVQLRRLPVLRERQGRHVQREQVRAELRVQQRLR